jgi:hypothetical protein
MPDDRPRVSIIVAIIGLVGVVGAAVISNWDKLFPPSTPHQNSTGRKTESPRDTGAAPTPRSPTSKPGVPATYSTGRLTIRGTWSGDLDLGTESTGTGADFWWEQATGTARYLVPKSGAGFYVVGLRDFASIGYADLGNLPYSGQKIEGSDATYNRIPQGTVVAYKTSDGRLGKFLVEEYGYNMTIRWLTYNKEP